MTEDELTPTLCPESKYPDLKVRIKQAQAIVGEFNDNAE